uniref:ParB/Sulfiredoxin domain-containing protein n=2 Tax=Aromatoleum buckelii TaxID=200254 RepID=A0ABX1N316_9RHOO
MEKRGKLQASPANATTGERRARLVQHSLAVKEAANAAADLQPGEDVDGWMLVRCMDIDCYDRNPRVRTNKRYADIRASIEARGGLKDALSVTRRPGANRYMCYFGGNTRLQIVQELWLETHDARYEWIRVVVHRWLSEADVIAAHLAENENRAETLFWEKARGTALLKSELESELQRPLSLRELSEHAQRCGLKLHSVTASNYLFAIDYLAPIGLHLTHESTAAIRSRFGCLDKLANALNLDPLVRQTAFEELVADLATEINAVREIDDPPRLGKDEVEMILSRMTSQFATLAKCTPSAAERAAQAVAGADRQLPDSEIRRLLCEPQPWDAASDATDAVGHRAAAAPLPTRKGWHARTGARFSKRIADFVRVFRLSDCVRLDPGRPQGFSVEPLPAAPGDPEETGQLGRAAAHRLLAQLSIRAGGRETEADPIMALLRDPSSWAATRSLLDAYHGACAAKPPSVEKE